MSNNSILATDTLFYSQLTITLVGIVFTGALIVVQPNNLNVYLPIFSSLLFSWLPSPISTKSINTQIKNVEEKLALVNHKIARTNIYRDDEDGDNLVWLYINSNLLITFVYNLNLCKALLIFIFVKAYFANLSQNLQYWYPFLV